MEAFRSVPVWSGFQRIIHWINAFAVLLLIPLGVLLLMGEYLGIPESGREDVLDLHGAIGAVLAAGALFRIIYLFTGPPASHWRDVLPHTRAQFRLGADTLKYYLSGFKGKAPVYFSHNPLAGVFDSILFIAFISQSVSGLTMFMFHEEEGAHANHAVTQTHDAEAWPPEWLLNIHDIGAAVIILFVLAHFIALGAHDLVERRGLVSSMISGRKFFNDEELKELEDRVRLKNRP